MPSGFDRIREEHDELLAWLDNVRMTADRIGFTPVRSVRELVGETIEFLVQDVLPHAVSEEEVLYPAVEKAMSAPGATATMTRDHKEIARLTDDLRFALGQLTDHEPADHQVRSLRRLLYGIEAIIRLHVAKEEELYLPMLERALNQSEADAMVSALEGSHRKASGRAVDHAHPGARSLTT